MQDRICPFSNTLLQDDFGCRYARQIVRRGGAEIACTAAAAHDRCTLLYRKLKDAALPAFEVEDDLLQMPHSVLVKIQYGGLLGLQRSMLKGDARQNRIVDIHALVDAAVEHYSSLEDVPCNTLVDDITAYRLSRRRTRDRK